MVHFYTFYQPIYQTRVYCWISITENKESFCLLSKQHLLVQSKEWKQRIMYEICSKLAIKTPGATSLTPFWCLHFWLWNDVTHCSGVYFVDLVDSVLAIFSKILPLVILRTLSHLYLRPRNSFLFLLIALH